MPGIELGSALPTGLSGPVRTQCLPHSVPGPVAPRGTSGKFPPPVPLGTAFREPHGRVIDGLISGAAPRGPVAHAAAGGPQRAAERIIQLPKGEGRFQSRGRGGPWPGAWWERAGRGGGGVRGLPCPALLRLHLLLCLGLGEGRPGQEDKGGCAGYWGPAGPRSWGSVIPDPLASSLAYHLCPVQVPRSPAGDSRLAARRRLGRRG